MEKWGRLWWTPCAAHWIVLMLEDIGKLNVHVNIFAKARQVVKFIYGHTHMSLIVITFFGATTSFLAVTTRILWNNH